MSCRFLPKWSQLRENWLDSSSIELVSSAKCKDTMSYLAWEFSMKRYENDLIRSDYRIR